MGRGKKPQLHPVDFDLQRHKWHMVTVSYVHNRMRSSQLSCLVDGKVVVQGADVTLPNTDDVRMGLLECVRKKIGPGIRGLYFIGGLLVPHEMNSHVKYVVHTHA